MKWLNAHKFEARLASFLLMAVCPIGLYWAAQAGADGWVYGLLALIVGGNVLAVLVR